MSRMTRVRIEIILSALFAVMAILTAVWPDWIEEVFGVAPDAGSGALEWSIAAGLAVLALASGAYARHIYMAAVRR